MKRYQTAGTVTSLLHASNPSSTRPTPGVDICETETPLVPFNVHLEVWFLRSPFQNW